jgi:hypothetical protein
MASRPISRVHHISLPRVQTFHHSSGNGDAEVARAFGMMFPD